MSVEELMHELTHLSKEIKLFNYEIIMRGINENTMDRIDNLTKRHLYLRSIAMLYGLI